MKVIINNMMKKAEDDPWNITESPETWLKNDTTITPSFKRIVQLKRQNIRAGGEAI